jgi:bicarbonate transport system substrate-binding protein
VISYPYKSHTNWFLLEAIRWKFFPGKLDTIDQANQINERTVRDDLWREAAKQVGVPAKDIPTGSSRGKEVFFDGTVYDPADPRGYLNSLKIKR